MSVIDASVATVLLTNDQRYPRARAAFQQHPVLLAPALALTETANALWKIGVDLTVATTYVLGELAERLELVPDEELLPAAMRLASELHHPVYDCLYLALAIARDEVVMTFDQRFVRVVEGSSFRGRVVDRW